MPQGLALMWFVCMEQRPSDKSPLKGMTESTLEFAGRADAADPSATPVTDIESPVYTISGHQIGSTFGGFRNSCLATSLSSIRIGSEAGPEAKDSPVDAESRI